MSERDRENTREGLPALVVKPLDERIKDADKDKK